MECLKLGVQVLLLVALISVGVQTHAVILVLAEIPQLNGVPAQQDIWLFKDDSLVLKDRVNCHMLIIDGELTDGKSVAVEEKFVRLGFTVHVKVDDRISQVVLAFSEC